MGMAVFVAAGAGVGVTDGAQATSTILTAINSMKIVYSFDFCRVFIHFSLEYICREIIFGGLAGALYLVQNVGPTSFMIN